ncbi:putative manganese transporter [Alteromonas macleodii]|uniref:putative manganese transporter n=1 Tax=Alteromonas macleodii TaxID=28108 RepID=UPI001E31AD73|nr:putative manganese transporter [Alteromonas macleodii]
MPLFIAILLTYNSTRAVTLSVLSDAFFQVAAFVYASLALYYVATLRVSAEAIGNYMKAHPVHEVGLSALLGALPGCGGAIIVVTQYTRGVTSFGAVVAVLTSTMGDAAFLLLAQAPLDALTVMAVSVTVGAMTGLVVNKFHNYQASEADGALQQSQNCDKPKTVSHKAISLSKVFWMIASLPSLAIALGLAFQLPVHSYLAISESTLTLIGAALCISSLGLWSLCGSGSGYASITKEDLIPPPPKWQEKAALDTQFVLAWVVLAFLMFELSVVWFGLDIAGLLQSMGPGLVGLAIIIGFLPGCGPQILVTSLYLNGAVPFSAQLGNAISNDGDALFPAIALSPKAALIATVYSAIPAFLVGYGYWYLFE